MQSAKGDDHFTPENLIKSHRDKDRESYFTLLHDLDQQQVEIQVPDPHIFEPGDYLQLGTEMVRVYGVGTHMMTDEDTGVTTNAHYLGVDRGHNNSICMAHPKGTRAYIILAPRIGQFTKPPE